MFSHILKLIINQWRGNLWILAELFISFICIWQVGNVFSSLLSHKLRDTGFDLEHVYRVTTAIREKDSPSYDPDSPLTDDWKELVERVRRCPGVESVGLTSYTAFPYTGSTNGRSYFGDTTRTTALRGQLTPDVIRVLHITSPSPEVDLVKETSTGQTCFLVSPQAMEQLYDKNTVRCRIYTKDERDKAYPGILCSYLTNEYADNNDNRALWEIWSEGRMIEKNANKDLTMLIRVHPDADHDFRETFLSTMRAQLTAGNLSIVNLTRMEDYRTYILNLSSINLMYGAGYFLAAFFFICAFLGIIGTFWFRTESRTSEIGLRMALGATRRQVRWQMIGEGLMLFGIVWLPAVIVSYVLRTAVWDNETLLSDTVLFITLTAVTTVLLMLLIVAGIWIPARQASRINPVDALHYE
ncbi:ABC transporter permease [Bacteroides sp. Marseille-P3684]|uniref:ABC transporter permease n=1 Tax=Bacteroides sp. Marseille-P3684 TaxID=2086579 RepID=UPI000D0B88FF|nr:FtsX-like permease family protein [Bacteroides sp. Marseille-P3684]